MHIFIIKSQDRAEKQLPERTSDDRLTSRIGLLGDDLKLLGESKLFLRSFPMAKIGCSELEGGLVDWKFLQTLMCLFKASSVVISFSDLKTSSFTASMHKPQIHIPQYLWRIRDIYAIVHSSVNPQESHLMNSTSPSAVEEVSINLNLQRKAKCMQVLLKGPQVNEKCAVIL